MPAKVTAAEVVEVILRLLRGVRVSAAAEVRAAARAEVQAEAVRGVHPVQVEARASVREVARVIARDRVRAVIGTVIPPAIVTAAAQGASILRDRAAEVTRRYPSRAKTQAVPVRASILILLPLAQGKKRQANLISQNTRTRKGRRCNEMIHIEAEHPR